MKFKDYVYWGAPVSENVVSQFPADFDRKYYWKSGPGSGWQGLTTTLPAQGFITRTITAGIAIPVTFTGTANNGIKQIAVLKEDDTEGNYANFALVSNPYPCAIDAKTFVSNPKNSIIGSTLYFWTSITPIKEIIYNPKDQYKFNYNALDYATWTFTGGTATAAKAVTDISGTDNLKPTGKIASGQAFFVKVKNNGNVYFDNSIRLTENVNTQFFKQIKKDPKPPSITEETEDDDSSKLTEGRIWLNISNKGNFRQMLLGYMKDATNGFDERFDGLSYSDSPVTIYTMIDNKDFVIQARQLPFDKEEIVPIGYSTSVAGDFYIDIDEADGFLKNKTVYLKDNLLNIDHNLKQNAYLFSTTAGTFNNRFELHYTNKSLGVDEVKQILDGVIVSVSGNQIKINAAKEEIVSVQVYDITGRKLLSKNDINKNETIIDKLSRQKEVLVVKVKLANNQEVSKKIIF